ncbi:hypothetical protein RirG_003630 [Rhizophagus irregularis DAOM 197198w]|uniref:Sel1 repeat domain-containing protein n=1 Tax=Rhizophagus irregularis (strain DAOM 197198w) TaxID=1432141 RepID=A0A015KJ57_RHIIW|nr:hypothetical protein RirG_003630 [Rhizophagus irregularis DAOM 197198w]
MSNNSKINNSLINNDFSHEISLTQNFNKINIKEIEPTTKVINKSIFEEDLSIVIDKLVNLICVELNKGKDSIVIKQHVFDYINNCKIILQEIYIYLLNNQNESNSIYLLGYFNNYGIETEVNEQRAIELYLKAANLENRVAQLNLVNEYIYGKGGYKNGDIAFELTKKLAEEEYACGINNLGYCYEVGIGTNVNEDKAFEFYQKAVDLGNINGINNLRIRRKDNK